MTHCYIKSIHVLNKKYFHIMKCKTDTKKYEEQYFYYNSTSFTNHRAQYINKHSSISTKHTDATILKYKLKYSRSWDLRLFTLTESVLCTVKHSFVLSLFRF